MQGGIVMAKPLLTDELWNCIEPHIQVRERRKRNPGREPLEDRRCLTGILFVLMSGIPWEMLPQEMGCGSGMTCWRRLRDWQQGGVWITIHQTLLSQLRNADEIDFTRCAVDSATIRAVGGRKNRP
jgi:transposase